MELTPIELQKGWSVAICKCGRRFRKGPVSSVLACDTCTYGVGLSAVISREAVDESIFKAMFKRESGSVVEIPVDKEYNEYQDMLCDIREFMYERCKGTPIVAVIGILELIKDEVKSGD